MNMKASNPLPPPGIRPPPPPGAPPAPSGAIPPPPSIDTGFVSVLSEDLESTVMHLCQHIKYLSNQQKMKLKAALALFEPPPPVVTQEVNYDASFDLAGEMAAQIKAVRAIRAHVFDAQGNIKEGISSREAKEVISSGSTLLASLMKYHKDVMNMDRLRKLEQSVVEALKDVDPDLQEDVMQRLEERMELEEQ